MANSTDPDQTSSMGSSLNMIFTVCASFSVPVLRVSMVFDSKSRVTGSRLESIMGLLRDIFRIWSKACGILFELSHQ